MYQGRFHKLKKGSNNDKNGNFVYAREMRGKNEFYKYVELKDIECIVQKQTQCEENV